MYPFRDRKNSRKLIGTVYYGLSDSRYEKRIYQLSDLLPLFQKEEVKQLPKASDLLTRNVHANNSTLIKRRKDAFSHGKKDLDISRYCIF